MNWVCAIYKLSSKAREGDYAYTFYKLLIVIPVSIAKTADNLKCHEDGDEPFTLLGHIRFKLA